jgi:hypothetical protein
MLMRRKKIEAANLLVIEKSPMCRIRTGVLEREGLGSAS